jgi:hypothetical protein
MMSVDGGVKYKGVSVEGEYYWRWLRNFTGVNTCAIANINDHGYQLQTSGMAVPKILRLATPPIPTRSAPRARSSTSTWR